MDYLNYVNDNFPIRRSLPQKRAFQKFVTAECKKMGINAQVETLQGKHENIVIGNPFEAQVLITAHYDTPASSLVPNLMMPRNPVLLYLYHFGYPIVLALFSLLLAYGVQSLFRLEYQVFAIVYMTFYLGIYYLCSRAFTNKHNKNDNTSGIAVILSLLGESKDGNVAFILFDNEEKGLLGSKAYAKQYKTEMAHKLLLNLDCVGVGENILVIVKETAEKSEQLPLLHKQLVTNGQFKVHYFSAKGSFANSDQKSFHCGVGIMTCKKSKLFGFYTTNIHTSKDTQANPMNIDFLCNCLRRFIQCL